MANAGLEPGTSPSLPGCDGIARGVAAALNIAVPPQTTGCPRSKWFPKTKWCPAHPPVPPEATGMGGAPFRRGRNSTILVRGSGRRKERRYGIKSAQPHSEQGPLANAGSEPGTSPSLPGCDGLARGFAAALPIEGPATDDGLPRSERFHTKRSRTVYFVC